MRSRWTSERLVESLDPDVLRRRLRVLGFQELDVTGSSGDTWIDPDNERHPALLVPRAEDRHRVGYDDLLFSAVERLSWVLGQDIDGVLDSLTRVGDEFELRIVDDATSYCRLPILRAPSVIEGFLGVLRGGARAEFRGARPTYVGGDPADVTRALDGIELLAPAPGSFRLIAISSVEAQLPLVHDGAAPDMSRRAVVSSMRALRAALGVTSEPPEDPDDLLDAVDQGLSSTILNGLGAIARGSTSLTVDFTTRLDATLPAAGAESEKITFTAAHFARVGGILDMLRYHEPVEGQEVTGWVKTVSADDLHPEGQPTGFVIVEVVREGRPRDVRIELPTDSFTRAQAGASLLTATGTLERIAGRWHLSDPTAISIRASKR
jgi:hypothetical protein